MFDILFGKNVIGGGDFTKSVGEIIKVTVTVMLVIGVICAAAYGIYRFLRRDYEDDFDDFDDAYDDDYDFYDDDFEDEFVEEEEANA